MTVQLIQKTLLNLISLGIQTFISQAPPVRFPPEKSQSKTQHLYTSIQLKIFVLYFISVSWYAENSEEKILTMKLLDIQARFSPKLKTSSHR